LIRTSLPHRLVLSPNIEPRKDGKTADMLLLHYTGMETAESACAWLCDPQSKVSCHYLIDEYGRITQMVGEEMRAWHAGASFWAGEMDINSRSIGIEIHNRGHLLGYTEFPGQQVEAVIALSLDIIRRNHIRPERVLAHSDVAPARKADPGEKFDWGKLHRAGIGHWTEPEPLTDRTALCMTDTGEDVRRLQADLARYGYGVSVTGVFESATETVVRAFQRHFRQARVDGRADHSTVRTLHRLLACLPDASTSSGSSALLADSE
jgi:N-acetylmuramoyl-L-alanine amidase